MAALNICVLYQSVFGAAPCHISLISRNIDTLAVHLQSTNAFITHTYYRFQIRWDLFYGDIFKTAGYIRMKLGNKGFQHVT